MQVKKRVVYPYVSLDAKGNFNHIGVQIWKSDDTVSVEYGFITIGLEPMEIEVQVPEDEQIRAAALQMLNKERDKLRGEFQVTLTKFQMLENSLLRIAAPEGVEVLDAVDTLPQMPARDLSRCKHCGEPRSKHLGSSFFCSEDRDVETRFEEDDIPF